jgi:hypothetical protein
MNARKGLGKGLGIGYKNLVPIDSHIHSLSAKGVKTRLLQMPTQLKKSIRLNAYGQEPVEVYEEGNYKAEIYPDEGAESPRNDDNFGTMVCFHNRYTLGDKTDISKDDFNSWEELEEYLRKEKKAVIILPLYLHDHSGLSMSVKDFNDHWDSGQVGYTYVTKEQLAKESKAMDKAWMEKYHKGKTKLEIAKEILKGEVETYDQYLKGDVYGYKVVEKVPVVKTYPDGKKVTATEEQEIDSVWGFYGQDEAMKEAKSIIKYQKEKANK